MADKSTEPVSYEVARDIADRGDEAARRDLASTQNIPQEILYFLANDKSDIVRRAVAANPTTPFAANPLLAKDADPEVRAALARRIGIEVRGGMPNQADRVRQVKHEALALLSHDDVAEVRALISEAVKDLKDFDHEVVRRLAGDLELMVAGPVLENSPVLTDDDLLEIIADNPIEGALQCISRRQYVDRRVTDAIVASREIEAITSLLHNAHAQIQESTLDQLIEESAKIKQWQEPLVYRPELRGASAVKLAQIVADHLLQVLVDRHDLDPDTIAKVSKIMRDRLSDTDPSAEPVTVIEPSGPMFGANRIEQLRERLKRLQPSMKRAEAVDAEGGLTDELIIAALLSNDRNFCMAALAQRSQLPLVAVINIISSRDPKALCALAWKAGLSAKIAYDLQIKLGYVDVLSALRPNEAGSFALSEDSMNWQLEMFLEASVF